MADVPNDFMDAAAIRARAEREIERQRRLAEARLNYDGEGVLALLADVDSGYPQGAELHRWAEIEIRRLQEIEEARRAYDGQGVLTALADAPSDYPHRLELYAWAQAEAERDQRLTEARRAYDCEGVLAILADVPADYPHLAELRTWAASESDRQARIKEAWESDNWEDALALLDQAPADYPKRAELRQETEMKLLRLRRLEQWLEQAQASSEAHDWETTLAICKEALASGGDEDQFGSLAEQVRQAQQREQAIAQAQSTIQAAMEQGDWEMALTHLRHLQALRPEQVGIQLQIADVQQRQARAQSLASAQQACVDQQWSEAIASLDGLPSDDDEATLWLQKARAGWIAELSLQAEAAENAADWSGALDALRQMQTLLPDDRSIARRLTTAEHEQVAASSLALAQAAAGRGRWKEAIAQAETARALFPDRNEAQAIIEQARQELITVRRRTRRVLLGVGALVAVIAVILSIVGSLVLAWNQRASMRPSPPEPNATTSEPTVISTQLEPATARPPQSTGVPSATSARDEIRASVVPTPTRPPTARPVAPVYPAPELIDPQDGLTAEGDVLFAWKWTGPALTANQGFEVRIWKQGQPDHYGAAAPVRTTNASIDVRGAYGVRTGGSGDFLWTVAIVQLNPYQRIGPEAPPRRLAIHVKD